MRLVLDTNVLVSALIFPAGPVSWLRNAWQSKAVLPLVSRETTTELIRTLCYPKFQLTANMRQSLLGDYLPWCEVIVTKNCPPVPVCRDPDDQQFLELAILGKADALVTGDDDLLALASEFSIPILSPGSIKKIVSRS